MSAAYPSFICFPKSQMANTCVSFKINADWHLVVFKAKIITILCVNTSVLQKVQLTYMANGVKKNYVENWLDFSLKSKPCEGYACRWSCRYAICWHAERRSFRANIDSKTENIIIWGAFWFSITTLSIIIVNTFSGIVLLLPFIIYIFNYRWINEYMNLLMKILLVI